ncbi:MFS transporter [[Collinsella] massiliensis]|uniref:MFS transporter n=1 Tax=[Collinsella] massiliensis TaxID=1232426 RepID=A0A1Y3XYC5_9ACTN|nr:MFS transporter [[Collinsella] massiliensis]OUN89308.1 MFS transporter [[Collinsella] massiliensis]
MDAQNKPAVTYRYWRAWPLILCSLMCYVLTGVVSSIVNVASVLFEADRGWDAALLTGGMSVASFINVVTGYIAGRMASRRSAKPVCIAWGVMFIAGVLAMGISTQVGVFVVAMCLANAAASAWGYNTMPVLITRWFPTRKGTVQGFASMGILLGSVSSMVYTWAYRTLGPALSTVPFVVFALVALVLLMALISDWPEQRGFAPDTMERCAPVADPASAELAEDAELAAGAATGAAEATATAELEEAGAARHAPAASEIRRFFANPVFVLLTVVLGLQLVFSGGIMVQLVPRLIEVGFTLDQSTLIMTLTSFLACAGSFGAGIIGDRFGAKAGVVLTFILGAVGAVAFPPLMRIVQNRACADNPRHDVKTPQG